MPGKSRRGRGRHLPRSKRRKGRKVSPAPAAQAPAVAQVHEPAPEADKPLPPTEAPKLRATLTAVQPPNIAAELRRIGILAGIILVILVVLALIFS